MRQEPRSMSFVRTGYAGSTTLRSLSRCNCAVNLRIAVRRSPVR